MAALVYNSFRSTPSPAIFVLFSEFAVFSSTESIQRSITCGNALPHQTFFLLVQPGRSGLSLVEKPLLSSPEAQHRSALHTKFLFHKEHDEMALYTFPLALIRFLDHSPRAVPNLVQPAALDPHL